MVIRQAMIINSNISCNEYGVNMSLTDGGGLHDFLGRLEGPLVGVELVPPDEALAGGLVKVQVSASAHVAHTVHIRPRDQRDGVVENVRLQLCLQ